MEEAGAEIQVLGAATHTLKSSLTVVIKKRSKESTDPVNDLGASCLAVDGDRNGLETMRASSPRLVMGSAVSKRGIRYGNDRFTGVFRATICRKQVE